MIPAASADDLLEIVKARVPRAWLDTCLSTPDGTAMLLAAVDMFVEVDRRDAERMSGLHVAPHSRQVAPPASGAAFATTTLAVARQRAGARLTLPVGTRVQTPDGHVFRTVAPLTFEGHELGVEKTVDAIAVVAGDFAVIPPDEITEFVPIAKNLTGAGVDVANVAVTGGYAIRLTTDATKPHPWRESIVGLPVEIVSGANNGKQSQIDRVTSGLAWGSAPDIETAYAWTPVTDEQFATWTTGAVAYEWAVRDWDEIGFTVRNTTRATGGRDGSLDALAEARGRPRRLGEGDESVRTRLRRRPLSPSAQGILEQVVLAIAPYGFGRHDVRIYELGSVPVNDPSPLAENFPPSGGTIFDLHVYDLDEPHTPDTMASRAPDGTTLSTFVNPGFIGEYGVTPWVVVVRVLVPSGFDEPTWKLIRLATWEATQAARQRGSIVQLYHLNQWGYP